MRHGCRANHGEELLDLLASDKTRMRFNFLGRPWNAQGRVCLDEIVINSPVNDCSQEREVAVSLIAGTAIHDFMDRRHHVAFRNGSRLFCPQVGRRFVRIMRSSSAHDRFLTLACRSSQSKASLSKVRASFALRRSAAGSLPSQASFRCRLARWQASESERAVYSPERQTAFLTIGFASVEKGSRRG